MSRSKELNKFNRGSIVGCHLYLKSVREIADILQKPKSTVNDVIVKWKRRDMEISQECQYSSGISVSNKIARRKLKNLRFHGRAATHKKTSLHRMRSNDSIGAEITVIGVRTCGKLLFGVRNLALQSSSRMDTSGFDGCPVNVSLLTALCQLLSLVVEA
ncbi:hypothetical protein TNCV_660591 [Trichonephila clavipes]|nr:hypothetical protein TNCV_660591 [Trichonephila clavipes]